MMAARKQAKEHARRAVQRPAARTLAPGRAQNRRCQSSAGGRITYSDDLAAKLCELVADGKSLKEACELPNMPARRTVYKWLAEHNNFMLMYARAREERADLVADEIITIADTETDPQKARNRIDARKWWAARVNPRQYGDRLVTTNHNHNYVISDRPMTEEEWETEYGPVRVGDAPTFGGVH
jgi:hypothetical protein